MPDSVDDQSAAFTVLSSIALHGIRLLQPTLGESFVVFGLGLLGQVAVQLLRAHGLIAKIPHCHRYRVTVQGEALMSAALYARYKLFPKELQNVAGRS